MQIILLSGGSGKRLWPLSNNTRSKQFLKLLPNPSGESESMVQRVARQISESGIHAELTVATGAAQRDLIVSQLGEGVNVVTEPMRRDTFPAIALASTYLNLEKQCASDEVVVVMPCDPFTDLGYFETIARMAGEVEKGTAELVLMGIKPSYASTKFGYVVPEQDPVGEDVYKVSRFTEKPSEDRAKELIAQNAFWNGGVFAFRLGYMTEIVSKYLKVKNFSEAVSCYSDLPKISFDYEVAEKAKSVAVLPFSGMWKDLGTWNALADEIGSSSIGNVILGEHAKGVAVINELKIPILCEGVEDIIVAADPDGILVCSKQHSEGIKTYVEKVESRPMFEERRWGEYKVIDETKGPDGVESLTKNLRLNPGGVISYQRHQHREEVWTFVSGVGIVRIEDETRAIMAGDVVHIKKGQRHGLKAVTPLTFIEVQIGTELVEEDIERLEMNW